MFGSVVIYLVGGIAIALTVAAVKSKYGFFPWRGFFKAVVTIYGLFAVYQIGFGALFYFTDESTRIEIESGEIFYGQEYSIDTTGKIRIRKSGLAMNKEINVEYQANPAAYRKVRFLASSLAQHDHKVSNCIPNTAHTYHHKISWTGNGGERVVAFQTNCAFEPWRDIWAIPYLPFQMLGVPVASGRWGKSIQINHVLDVIENEVPETIWPEPRHHFAEQ